MTLTYDKDGNLIHVPDDVFLHHRDCDYRNSALAGEDGYSCNLGCLDGNDDTGRVPTHDHSGEGAT